MYTTNAFQITYCIYHSSCMHYTRTQPFGTALVLQPEQLPPVVCLAVFFHHHNTADTNIGKLPHSTMVSTTQLPLYFTTKSHQATFHTTLETSTSHHVFGNRTSAVYALYKLANQKDDPPLAAFSSHPCNFDNYHYHLLHDLCFYSQTWAWLRLLAIQHKPWRPPFHVPKCNITAGKHTTLQQALFSHFSWLRHFHWHTPPPCPCHQLTTQHPHLLTTTLDSAQHIASPAGLLTVPERLKQFLSTHAGTQVYPTTQPQIQRLLQQHSDRIGAWNLRSMTNAMLFVLIMVIWTIWDEANSIEGWFCRNRLVGSNYLEDSLSCLENRALAEPWIKRYEQGATEVPRGRWPTTTPLGYLCKRTCEFNTSNMARWLSQKPPMPTWHDHIAWHNMTWYVFISSHFILSLRGVSTCVCACISRHVLIRHIYIVVYEYSQQVRY